MEGQVTSYSGTTLVINVDVVGGSGTFADWNISLVGQVGSLGLANPSTLGMTGVQLPWGGRTAPAWGLLEYGQAVSRSTYAALFGVIVPLVGTCTISQASPGVVTLNGHGFVTGDSLYFTTTGALPAPLAANTLYYVIAVNANTFRLATSLANAFVPTPINTTNAGSGTHSCYACPYGLGNGSTTFNVPDKRGRVSAGADAMGGTAASRLLGALTGGVRGVLGATGGEEGHTLAATESGEKGHNHTQNAHSHGSADGYGFITTQYVNNANSGSGLPLNISSASATTANATATNQVVAASAAASAHNTVSPTQVDNWIIVI
jgi:microcystin-dependent protein